MDRLILKWLSHQWYSRFWYLIAWSCGTNLKTYLPHSACQLPLITFLIISVGPDAPGQIAIVQEISWNVDSVIYKLSFIYKWVSLILSLPKGAEFQVNDFHSLSHSKLWKLSTPVHYNVVCVFTEKSSFSCIFGHLFGQRNMVANWQEITNARLAD